MIKRYIICSLITTLIFTGCAKKNDAQETKETIEATEEAVTITPEEIVAQANSETSPTNSTIKKLLDNYKLPTSGIVTVDIDTQELVSVTDDVLKNIEEDNNYIPEVTQNVNRHDAIPLYDQTVTSTLVINDNLRYVSSNTVYSMLGEIENMNSEYYLDITKEPTGIHVDRYEKIYDEWSYYDDSIEDDSVYLDTDLPILPDIFFNTDNIINPELMETADSIIIQGIYDSPNIDPVSILGIEEEHSTTLQIQIEFDKNTHKLKSVVLAPTEETANIIAINTDGTEVQVSEYLITITIDNEDEQLVSIPNNVLRVKENDQISDNE